MVSLSLTTPHDTTQIGHRDSEWDVAPTISNRQRHTFPRLICDIALSKAVPLRLVWYTFSMRALHRTIPHCNLDSHSTMTRPDSVLANPMTAMQVVCVIAILVMRVTNLTAAKPFSSDSKCLKNSTVDIVVTETERHPQTSVVEIQIKANGSSVGSSFFLLCSIRDLAQQRGHYRYIAKVEDQPSRNHMSIGFLRGATEAPEQLDARLAGHQVIDLQQFSPICDKMR